MPTRPLEGSAFAGRDGCPQPSVRRQIYVAPSTSYSLWSTGRDSTTCCPSCLSALGRDGCPQPSVRGQTHVPRSTSYPLPLPRLYSQPLTANRFHLAAPPSLPSGHYTKTMNQKPRTRLALPLSGPRVLRSSCPRLRPVSPCSPRIPLRLCLTHPYLSRICLCPCSLNHSSNSDWNAHSASNTPSRVRPCPVSPMRMSTCSSSPWAGTCSRSW